MAREVKHKVGLANLMQKSAQRQLEKSKVALSFKDLESKEKRERLRREPKMTIGKDRTVPVKEGTGPQLGM